jgi:hypothetical protein
MRIRRPVALAVATAALAGSGLLLAGTANAATTNTLSAAHTQTTQVVGVPQSYQTLAQGGHHHGGYGHRHGGYGRSYGHRGRFSYGYGGHFGGRHGR